LPLVYAIFALTCWSVLTQFRLAYFGYLFPNTYYAKVSGSIRYNFSEGFKYLWGFTANFNPLISLLLVYILVRMYSLIILLHKSSARKIIKGHEVHSILFVLIIAVLFIPLLTGGDHFGGYRFYTMLIPLLFLVFVIMWIEVNSVFQNYSNFQSSSYLFLSIFTILCMTMSLHNLKKIPQTQLDYDFYITTEGRKTGENFNKLFTNKFPSAGVVTAGSFALTYNGNTIDLMGLNNTEMAHSSGNRNGVKNHAAFSKVIFYKLKPDIVLPKYISSLNDAKHEYFDLLKNNNFENMALKNIFNDNEFLKYYQPYHIKNKLNGSQGFAFIHSDWINSSKHDHIDYFKLSFR